MHVKSTKNINKTCFRNLLAVDVYYGFKHDEDMVAITEKTSLSLAKLSHLCHEPLHSVWVDCIGPVTPKFKVGTNNHCIGIEVAFDVVVCHSGPN